MGTAIWGNTIFDALFGAPGTYFQLGPGGSVQWGFPIDKWYADEGAKGNPTWAERLKEKIAKYPECAALFDGVDTANDLIDSFVFVNVDTFSGTPWPNLELAQTAIQGNEERGGPVRAYGDIPPPGINNDFYPHHIYIGNDFYTLSSGAQETLVFHELEHNGGRPNESSDQERERINQEIREKCHTEDK